MNKAARPVSAVLARHAARADRSDADARQPGPAGLRQYQVLQSRTEPAQRTLGLKRR